MMPNFSRAELECKCGCGLADFAPGFLQALQGLRDVLGEPMILSSACRCYQHNEDEDGHLRSLHVGDAPHWATGGCCAVDVTADAESMAAYRAKLSKLAWDRGWSIGYHPQFLHLDLRTEYAGLPQKSFNY